jgi:hypothetical protein
MGIFKLAVNYGHSVRQLVRRYEILSPFVQVGRAKFAAHAI